MNIQIRVLSANATAQIKAMQAEIGRLNSALSAASAASGVGNGRQLSALSKYGNQLQWTGRQLQYNFTLPIALAGAAATKFALDNEQAFTRIKKVYGDAGMSASVLNDELNALKGAFVALSDHYGVQQEEVLNIAADWAAAGASGVALARGVEQTLRTMVLGEMDAASATEALIAIQAQYNLSSKQLVDTIAMLNIVENQTGISLEGLVQGFSRAAGVARSAGVDTEHLAAMLAALTPAAGSAAQAGNALKTIISRLQSPTKEAVQVLGAMGIQTDSMSWKSANATQKIELLSKKYQGLSDAQKGVVSSTLASRYQINKFEALMDSVYKSVDNNVKTTGYYGRALDATANRAYYLAQSEKELRAVLESNPQKFKQVWVILQNAMADVIIPLIPVMLMAANAVKRLAEGFRNLPPELQKAITYGLLFLALFGPLLRYIGSTMTLVGELSWFFTGLGKAVLLVFSPFNMLGSALLSIGKKYMLLRGAVLTVTAALVSGAGTWEFVLTTLLGPKVANALIGTGRGLVAFAVATNKAFIGLFTNLVPMIFLMMGRVTQVIRVGAIAIPVIFAEMSAAVVALWRNLQVALTAISYATVYVAGVAWRAGLTVISAIQIAWNYGITAAWRTLQIALSVLSAEGWKAISVVWTRGLVALKSVLIAFAAFSGGIWRAMLGSITTMTVLFGANLKKIFLGFIPMIRAASLAALDAMTGPWGIAITAVILLLITFRKQIAQLVNNIIQYFQNLPPGVAAAFKPIVGIFNSAVSFVLRAFNALPVGVRNALIAVVNIVASAARQVYQLFSYLNPFAHHSPSLVENVTKGMAVVKAAFASITDISGPINKAYQDIKKFGVATAALLRGMDTAKRADDRANLAKVAPGALDEFDALVHDVMNLTTQLNKLDSAMKTQQSIVDGLKASLDAANASLDVESKELDRLQKIADEANASLDAAKQSLQDYANTPITGMRDMEDQIFANEMAQKNLRLEMLKMDDAVGGIDKLKDKMNQLSGQIELVSGEQASLRSAGAGSEILSQYDDQIKGLESQQQSINDTISQYDSLSDELDKLQRQGEELDLEKSLKFDELTRQIDQAANAMKEMPFDDIMAGIQQANADIEKYGKAVDEANAAVAEQQKVVDAATAARDAIAAQYDVESAKLDKLKDQYDQVNSAIQDINSSLSDMTQAAEDAIRRQQDALKKGGSGGSSSPGLENFNAGAGGNFPEVGGAGSLGREGGLGSQAGDIEQFTKDLAQSTSDLLGSFDLFGPVKKKWEQFKGWFKANLAPAFGAVGDIWDSTVGKIDWLGPFRGIDTSGIKKVFDTIKDIFSTAASWGKRIWDLFKDDFKEIWDTIKKAVADAGKELGPELAKFKDLIGPAGEAFQKLWTEIKPVVAILGVALLGALKIVTSVLANTLGPALHMIIDVLKGVIEFIRGFIEIIIGAFTGNKDLLWQGVKDMFGGLVDIIWGILKNAGEAIWGIVKGIVEGIVDFFKWLYDTLVGHSIIPDMINDIITWIASLPGKAMDALKDLGAKIISVVKAAWDWWVKVNAEALIALIAWLKALPQKAYDALSDIVNKLRSRASEAWTAFKTKASEVWSSIVGWISGLGTAAYNALADIAGKFSSRAISAMNSMKNGFTSTWSSINSWLRGTGGRILSGIGNLGSILTGAGRSVMQSLWNGMKDKWNDIKGWLGGLGGQIKDLKGPIEKDRVLLQDEGEAILFSLEKGMKNQWPSVQDFAQSIGPAITDAVHNSLSSTPAYMLKSPTMGTMSGAVWHAEAMAMAGATEQATVIYGDENKTTHYHFYGDLEFPNVKSGDDAEEFLKNLEALISEA